MSDNHKKISYTDTAFWKRIIIACFRAFLSTYGPIKFIKSVRKNLQKQEEQYIKMQVPETIKENVSDQINNLDNISDYSNLTIEQITTLRIALLYALQNDREALKDHVKNWIKSDPNNPDANFCASPYISVTFLTFLCWIQ